jgi:hypothetical protein
LRHRVAVDHADVMAGSVDFRPQGHSFVAMTRLAAIMMFAAWLLYGAMPVMAMPTPSTAQQPTAEMAMQDHAQHHDMATAGSTAPSPHAHGDAQSQCPHGSGKGCMAPFCAACLVLLPQIAFADPSRFVHPHPAPEPVAPLVISASRPPTPPPRA